MKKTIVLVLVVFMTFLSGCKESGIIKNEPPDSTLTRYDLDVYVDVENSRIELTGSIKYKNEIGDLNSLFLNMYPFVVSESLENTNYEINDLSIVDYESAYSIDVSNQGSINITTEKSIPLNEVIEIVFDIEYSLWDDGRIYGGEDYVNVMFFYPFVAMYDDSGWNTELYSFHGETYYNEIGNYYVSINVPDSFLIAASGKEVNSEVKRNRLISDYELFSARDFSFSASSSYSVYNRTINGIDFEIYSIRNLTTVEVENSFQYLEDSFYVFEDLLGEYYYDHFTLEYGRIFGMESSGIIYCSSEISEGTVVHEVLHQWFYSMVGNDQFDESFLDEALTTYGSALYYRYLYGMDGYNGSLEYRSSLKESLNDRFESAQGLSSLRTVDEMDELYGYLIYYHGPTMIDYYIDTFLEGDIDLFVEILSVYFDMYDGKVATIDEFLDLLETQTGIENTKEWFLMQLESFQDLDNRP